MWLWWVPVVGLVVGVRGGLSLDCQMKQLAYQRALNLQPHRGVQRETYDALRLGPECDVPPPAGNSGRPPPPHGDVGTGNTYYVDPLHGKDTNAGTETAPFLTVHRAIDATRAIHEPGEVVLRQGTHYLSHSITLGVADSGIVFHNYPGEVVWVSGGTVLPKDLEWKHYTPTSPIPKSNIWVATLPASSTLSAVRSLMTVEPFRRMTRARFPNGDVERDQWGYDTPTQYEHAIHASTVEEWWRPPNGPPPKYTYTDLRTPNPSGAIKYDSTMKEYNMFGEGHGGVCSHWGTSTDPESYWCSNISAGGWAEVDRQMVTKGMREIPIGMTYNKSVDRLKRFSTWRNATGALIHVWHPQSWFTNMFEVIDHDVGKGRMTFGDGGWQGGRNWCACNECSYAGPWCHKPHDTRIISGSWYVDGVLEELDTPAEYFYDAEHRQLYLWPNTTGPPQSSNYVVPQLNNLITISGTQQQPVKDVLIQGVRFRDTTPTFMERWGVPSGGDWSLYRGGAIHMEGVSNVTVVDCLFERLEGNALMLSKYTRNVTVERNEFVWIGDNVVAAWGITNGYDGTSGDQPRFTRIVDNYIHEVGMYEKQSSPYFQAKACQTHISGNIMFNLPRAAINLNDGFGGGNDIVNNLIFNSCRESGDHGPINSWDRQPFLTRVRTGVKSFSPADTTIHSNYIIANYGGSQGVDNDDGSSWYDIYDNVFYSADGFKMDYGGHDSHFHHNLVVTLPYDGQNCINVGSFMEGHGDDLHDNRCIVMGPQRNDNVVTHAAQCDPKYVTLARNAYYSPGGNASLKCGGSVVPLKVAQQVHHVELGSTANHLPSTDEIVQWAKEKLNLLV